MISIAERRAAAYAKLAEVVEELSALDDLEAEDIPHNVATHWVLAVGYECLAEGGSGTEGMVGVYPKDQCAPGWKSEGLLRQAARMV